MPDYNTEENKTKLINELKNSDVEIRFKKVNGDERIMYCTLREAIIPTPKKADPMSQKKVRKISPEVLAVWDINKNSWRSMRWENIIQAEAKNEQQLEKINIGSTP